MLIHPGRGRYHRLSRASESVEERLEEWLTPRSIALAAEDRWAAGPPGPAAAAADAADDAAAAAASKELRLQVRHPFPVSPFNPPTGLPH